MGRKGPGPYGRVSREWLDAYHDELFELARKPSALPTLLYLISCTGPGARFEKSADAHDWEKLVGWATASAGRAGIDPGDAGAVEAWARGLQAAVVVARDAAAWFGVRGSSTHGRMSNLVQAGVAFQAVPSSKGHSAIYVLAPVEFKGGHAEAAGDAVEDAPDAAPEVPSWGPIPQWPADPAMRY